jgi:hypothetical protein
MLRRAIPSSFFFSMEGELETARLRKMPFAASAF